MGALHLLRRDPGPTGDQPQTGRRRLWLWRFVRRVLRRFVGWISCSSGGGCGCGGSCSSGPSTPANCEPTQICEGYRFTLTKVRPEPRRKGNMAADHGTTTKRAADRFDQLAEVKGDLPGQVMECLRGLSTGLSQLPQNPAPTSWSTTHATSRRSCAS